MRHRVTSISGWLWILGFLTLPDCQLVFQAEGSGPNLVAGDQPHSSVVFCDIEDKSVERRCATPEDEAAGVRLSQAAILLTRGESNRIGLDFSPAARAALGCGAQPVAVFFKGAFPKGTEVCLNCDGVIGPGKRYPDAAEACQAKCQDLNGSPEGKNPADQDVVDFCATATTSTNASTCFEGACTDAGNPRADFADPRLVPEPVVWTDRSAGVALEGPSLNGLRRTSASPDGSFDEGAASGPEFTRGDGYVEFTVIETNTSRVLGLALGGGPDNDHSFGDIDFAARLSTDGHVFVFEDGVLVPGPNPDTSFATYASGDRIRISLTDNFDGSANVTYSVIPSSCQGPKCDGMVLRTTGPAPYPFRVDGSLREQGATLADVRVVRIK